MDWDEMRLISSKVINFGYVYSPTLPDSVLTSFHLGDSLGYN